MYLLEPKRNGVWMDDLGTNMALQEYVRNHLFLDDDILFPYMMQPSVQIGKFQNAYEEVNQSYIDAHDMKVVRRDTGGGAVYLDYQNMSFCFLVSGGNDIYGNYTRLYKPAIQALEKLGVQGLEQKGRNDLILDGKKISGAAMTLENGRIYCGYSLLLDPDYEAMTTALNPNQKKIQSHGIQSVRSRVGAIRPYLAPKYQDMTVWEFTDHMICELLHIENINEAKRYILTQEDWACIDQIAKEKYNNWDWNYGRFKQFEYHLTERFPCGTIRIGLTIEHARIADLKITGDFLGTKDVRDIEKALIGVRLRKGDLLDALEPIDLTPYVGELTNEAFVHFILNEK